MGRKKILFIHESLKGGGAEKVFADLIRRFDFNRYDVTLLLLFGGGPHEKNLPPGLKVITVYPKPHSFMRRVVWHFRSSRNRMLRRHILKALGNEHFDVTVSFLEGPALLAHSFLSDRAPRNISWVHVDMYINHWTRNFFKNIEEEGNIYRKMDETVYVSESARIAHKKLFGDTGKSRVILNIIEGDAIRRRATEKAPVTKRHALTICNVGRLSYQKKQDRLIEAVRLLVNDYGIDAEAWIVGQGEDKEKLMEQTRAAALEDRITFCGFHTNPYPFINEADLFVLTSETEGYPLVVCEALCIGKPVVSTAVTGPTEVLADDSGVLTGQSPKEIAAAIADLASDPRKMAYYADRAKQRSAMFRPERTMTEIYNVIEGITS